MEKKSPKERVFVALDDEALVRVTGGTGEADALICPLCKVTANKYICENLQCSNYGSYITSSGK